MAQQAVAEGRWCSAIKLYDVWSGDNLDGQAPASPARTEGGPASHAAPGCTLSGHQTAPVHSAETST